MSELINKFIENLNIPRNITDNLYKKRNNDQLKVFALTIPDILYPDTYILAGRLLIYVNIKLCPKDIKDYVEILKDILKPEIKDFIIKNSSIINEVLDETYYENFKNQNISSASANIIYLLKISHEEPPVETPCQLKMRQAVQFYFKEGIERVLRCYYQLVEQVYVHASPTMFNAGCVKGNLASCVLLTLGDNLEDLLYTGGGDVGMLSKVQAGIGMNLNAIRHSNISNSGKSQGALPFASIYNEVIKCVNQGGKRNGAITLTLNDWHIDFPDFIRSRDNYTQNGIRFDRANIAAFITNLFMERVKNKEKWTLFCPAKAKIGDKKLLGTFGPEFEELYIKLELEAPKKEKEFNDFNDEIKAMEVIINSEENISEEIIKNYHNMVKERVKMRKNLIEYKVVDANDLYRTICDMNVKSGMPYITYRDPVNLKNNTMNIGVTESLNLCVAPETLVWTDYGPSQIYNLENKKVNIWNGEEFSMVEVKKTGTNQELFKVVLEDGRELECTNYHKFYVKEGLREVEYRTHQLVKGMNLIDFKPPNKEIVKNYNVIKEVIKTNRFDDTYCFNEPKRNRAWFNGMVTGQCLEITLPSTPDSISTCNLGHLDLKRFIKKDNLNLNLNLITKENLKDYYDFEYLGDSISDLVENINKVIDYNYYLFDKMDKDNNLIRGKISTPNFANRPIGIGVSGLAEVFALLHLPFESDLAKHLNKMIFAAMYYYSLKKSNLLAIKEGEYETFRTGESKIFIKDKGWQIFKGSPLSNGFFQFDLWECEGQYLKSINRINDKIYKFEDNIPINPSEWGDNEGNWDDLREVIKTHGARNSMLLAPMPTASSAQLLRNAESFEAHQTLIYTRKLVHGNIITFSEPFINDLEKLGLLNSKMIQFIEMDNGSIRYIDHFIKDNPSFFKDFDYNNNNLLIKKLQKVHRGMYEISQKDLMLMSRQRGIYIDQSQSLNIYIPEPNVDKMVAVHAYSNALQLKTGMYYLRQNPASQTDRFTVDIDVKEYYNQLIKKLKVKVINNKKVICTDEVCISCQ